MRSLRTAGAALIALILAGCAGGPSLSSEPAPAGANFSMAGRWILSAPNAPTCGLSFSGATGKYEGNVVPEGGCPERFFASRRWTLDNGALTINDDTNSPLARLTFASGRFEGKSAADTPVTLTR